MATFEDEVARDVDGNCRQPRSWNNDGNSRRAPREQRQKKAREPYLRIDNRKFFRRDLEELSVSELDDIVDRLQVDNNSIDEDLPSLSGDAEIKARDKMKFNLQWITIITKELIVDYDEDDAYIEYDDDDDVSVGTSPKEMVNRLRASINKHLSIELATVILNDAMNN